MTGFEPARSWERRRPTRRTAVLEGITALERDGGGTKAWSRCDDSERVPDLDVGLQALTRHRHVDPTDHVRLHERATSEPFRNPDVTDDLIALREDLSDSDERIDAPGRLHV